MGQVPPPKEPSGCIQTAVISRMIAQILFVPFMLIFAGVVVVVLAVYAFAEHFLFGFGLIIVSILLLTVVARWEYIRVKRELPPQEDVDRIDPRLR